MSRSFVLEKGYYAARPHDSAPWLIRNQDHRVVGHYSADKGVQWGDLMDPADMEWLSALLKTKLN